MAADDQHVRPKESVSRFPWYAFIVPKYEANFIEVVARLSYENCHKNGSQFVAALLEVKIKSSTEIRSPNRRITFSARHCLQALRTDPDKTGPHSHILSREALAGVARFRQISVFGFGSSDSELRSRFNSERFGSIRNARKIFLVWTWNFQVVNWPSSELLRTARAPS